MEIINSSSNIKLFSRELRKIQFFCWRIYQEQLENDFNNYYVAANGEYEIDGQSYNVSFEISFNVVENDNDMPSADSQDGSTNLEFNANKNGAGSHKLNTISLNKSPRGMAGAEDTGGSLSHEIIHALGVTDTKENTSGKLSSWSVNRSLQPSEVSTMLTPGVKYANDNENIKRDYFNNTFKAKHRSTES